MSEPKNWQRSGQKPAIWFKTLHLPGGLTIELGNDDVVAFVGPNNAGKSQALSRLSSLAALGPQFSTQVRAELAFSGLPGDLYDALGANLEIDNSVISGFRFRFPIGHLENWHNSPTQFLALFIRNLGTNDRLNNIGNTQPANSRGEVWSHPIHVMHSDESFEKIASSYFKRAFGQELIFANYGTVWELWTGPRPHREPNEERGHKSWLNKVERAAQPLNSQGDGMKAFANVTMQMLAPGLASVLTLDEPEAFLHPPQARLIGELVAKERRSDSQLFIATHSEDVVQGLLDAAPEKLKIIRLSKRDNTYSASHLDNKKTNAIRSDSFLRYSRVLPGIFHSRAIVCESDSDCLFYRAILDANNVPTGLANDVHFVHASGKSRVAQIAESLRALSVDVDVIVDIDILRDINDLKKLIMAMGGDWTAIETSAQKLHTSISAQKTQLSNDKAYERLRDSLEDLRSDQQFLKKLVGVFKALGADSTAWTHLKGAGAAAIPSGHAQEMWNAINSFCKAIGIWIVPVGEVEGFDRLIDGHGPSWVQTVLERRDLGTSPELRTAREFISMVWNKN